LNQPNVGAAIDYALHRLSVELPPHIVYHSVEHTRDEVLVAVAELAQLARLAPQDADALRIAAAYHDLGFIERPDDHEICSARVAAQVLPAFAFASRAVEQVMSLILATRLPRAPRSFLEALMCDADLCALGEDSFHARSADLLRERRAFGQELSEREWWQEQIGFLAQHRYWTDIAEELWAPGKARNLLKLEQRLAELSRED
jgi:uncharacterized protein